MFRKFLVAAIFAAFVLHAAIGLAQSRLQSVDSNFKRVVATSFDSSFPSSMSSVQRNIFAILYAPRNGKLSSATTCGELMAQMRQIGLQVVLDESAKDDSLTASDSVEVPRVNLQNSDLLDAVLSPHNATLALVGNRLSIVSRDVADAPEYFTILVYDVSHLTQDAEWFVDEIKYTIAPDDWNDTNGDGSADIRQFKGRKLMTVAQSLNVHLQIQEYMRGLARLQGIQGAQQPSPPSSSAGSRIVSPSQTQTDGASRYSNRGGVF